jgi:hypothetical protein
MHKPLWNAPAAAQAKSNWDKIEPLLAGRAHTIFTGHEHKYLYVGNGEKNQRFILCTTGGGNSLTGAEYGNLDMIVWVTMTAGGPKITPMNLDGVLPMDFRTRQSEQALNAAMEKMVLDIGPVFAQTPTFESARTSLMVANNNDKPVIFRGLFRPGINLQPSQTGFYLVLDPGQAQTIPLTLTATQTVPVDQIKPVEFEWSMTTTRPGQAPLEKKGVTGMGVCRLFDCRPAAGAMVVDGKLNDWPTLDISCTEPGQTAGPKTQYQGPQDSSFQFAVTYDANYFYIGIHGTDDTVLLNPEKMPWEQDGYTLMVDARPDPARSLNGPRKVWTDYLHLNFTVGKDGKTIIADVDKMPPGILIAATQTPTGIDAELAIPIKWLDEQHKGPWQAVRLNVSAFDFDGPKDAFFQYSWLPRWNSSTAVSGSGTFKKK